MSNFSSTKVSKVTGVLLLLFAISVLISQSLMDLFSTVLCFYLAFQWFKARKQGISLTVTPKMGFDWLWLVWFGVTALGFILNAPPTEIPPNFWIARLVEFKWILILYFMVGAFQLTSIHKPALKWFSLSALICAIYGIVTYYFELKANPGQSLRLGGIYQFSMTHAHVYGVVFCFLFGLLLENFRSLTRAQKTLSITTIIVVGASVLLTYTRGVWISTTVAIIALCFLSRVRTGFIAIFAITILVVGLYSFAPGVKNRIDFTAKMANAKEAKESYDSERIVLWKTNLMIFKDHPLFGTGYGQNKFLLREYYNKQGLPKDQFIGHAHNQYLHLLAGTGALGLLCYLGILTTIGWLTLKAFLRTPRTDSLKKGLALGALGGHIAFAVGSLTESNFEHSKVRFAIMFMWAIGLWLWRERKSA